MSVKNLKVLMAAICFFGVSVFFTSCGESSTTTESTESTETPGATTDTVQVTTPPVVDTTVMDTASIRPVKTPTK